MWQLYDDHSNVVIHELCNVTQEERSDNRDRAECFAVR